MQNIGKIPIWLLFALFGLSHATERVSSPALPQIALGLGVDGSLVQLSSGVYFVGFAIGIITMGRLSDITGRRPLVLIGLALYCIAALLCSHAPNVYLLLVGRFIQAMGASVGSVLAQAMARDSFEGKELAQVYVGVAISLSFVPSMGLIIGGYLVEYINWNANFWVLGVAGIIMLGLCGHYLPETSQHIGTSKHLSYFNILKRVATDKKVVLYALIIGCVSGMTIGFYVEAPFIFIDYFKMQPSQYGLIGFAIAGANLAGGLTNRYLVKRHISSYLAISYGIALSFAGCVIMFVGSFFLNSESSVSTAILIIVIPSMMHAMGHTFAVPHILHFALEDYREFSGTAGSIFGSFYYFIVAIVSFAISRIHGYSIASFTTLFLGLSITSVIAFLMIRMIVAAKTKNV
ncbi:MAG UNVERIFIED_CONTAM: multidrug effflux MFS transporter [Rickettsiaceae bacterium]|jgi:Bcr/CflA subfamily drug resistance transporter